MGLFLDILTGRIFNFSNAKGADINVGASDRLIVTPKALSQSEAYTNTSIPLVLASPFATKNATFSPSPYQIIIPSNGFLFPNRSNKIKVQVFANVIADVGSKGEICIWDVGANAAVANTTFGFDNSAWTIKNSNLFSLDAGKVYTLALRKTSGKPSQSVQLASAILTLQIPAL